MVNWAWVVFDISGKVLGIYQTRAKATRRMEALMHATGDSWTESFRDRVTTRWTYGAASLQITKWRVS